MMGIETNIVAHISIICDGPDVNAASTTLSTRICVSSNSSS